MHFKRKGSVTVFLTLMMTVLAAFVAVLSSYAKIFTQKSEAVYAVDNAVRSCFAEYNRELFARFHILLIDSSYKAYDSGKDRVAGHFSTYIENSMTGSDFCYADIGECYNASESDGEYIYDAGVGYAKTKLGVDERLPGNDEDTFFLTYLINVLGDRERPLEGAQRAGEIEYLLYGSESDDENIDLAVTSFEENEEEISYEDHLCRCLAKEDISIVRRRFCELLTEYMRENGSPGFDLVTCYHDISFSVGVEGRGFGDYCITRRYSYEI